MKALSSIASWIKVVTLVISFIAGVGGGIAVYNKWVIKKYDQQQQTTRQEKQLSDMQQSFNTVIDSLSLLSDEVRSIKPQINAMDNRIDGLISSNNNLRTYMMNRALNKDEVLEIIRIWDNEKKNNNIVLTPLPSGEELTQRNLK